MKATEIAKLVSVIHEVLVEFEDQTGKELGGYGRKLLTEMLVEKLIMNKVESGMTWD